MKYSHQMGYVIFRHSFLMILFALVVVGCAAAPKEFVFDSPKHRLTNGFRLLELGRSQDARREFKGALMLDSECCAAYRGIGLSLAMEERFQDAFKAMAQAKTCAHKEADKALAEVGFMRVVMLQKAKGWVDRVERYFEKALDFDPNSFEAYYYLGAAYAQGRMFRKALWAYNQAVKIGGPQRYNALSQLEMVKKVVEASPDTVLGEDMALKPVVTRADVAALFVRELHLGDIYLRRTKEKLAVPQDIRHHRFKKEIMEVLEMGIQGLTLLQDGSFSPEASVSRAEFATMLADILRHLCWKGLGRCNRDKMRNPFDDVSAEDPYFADVMICTRCSHIMGPEQGLFEPMELVSGPDALLAIKKLKIALAHE